MCHNKTIDFCRYICEKLEEKPYSDNLREIKLILQNNKIISELFESDKKLSVQHLRKRCGMSESCIGTNLAALEERNLITKKKIKYPRARKKFYYSPNFSQKRWEIIKKYGRCFNCGEFLRYGGIIHKNPSFADKVFCNDECRRKYFHD